jgi:hypothetical protein
MSCLPVKWSLAGLHFSHFSIKQWQYAHTVGFTYDDEDMLHTLEVKNLPRCTYLLARFTICYLAGQCIVKLRIRRITCTADNMQYASTRYLQLTCTSGENNCGNTRSMEGRDLSMQCLRDYWHWLKIRGLERTGFLIDTRMHRNVILWRVKIYVGIVSVGCWLNLWCNAE